MVINGCAGARCGGGMGGLDGPAILLRACGRGRASVPVPAAARAAADASILDRPCRARPAHGSKCQTCSLTVFAASDVVSSEGRRTGIEW